MVALTLSPHAAFIKRAPRLIDVLLAAKVARHHPRKVILRVVGEEEIENAAGFLHPVTADRPIFVETHCVNDYREHVSRTDLQI